MKHFLLYLTAFLLSLPALSQTRPNLGNARTFTVLAGTQITNSGATVIDGNIGVAPGTTVTGFPPGVVNGAIEINNSVSQNAQANLTTAYNSTAAQTPTNILTGQNLGGKTLLPGVHKFAGPADLTGTLIFDANGDINAVFIIQIDNNFTTAPNAMMNLRNGARELNIFYQIGGSATIGAGTSLKGTLMANQDITMGTGANLNGRLFSRFGFVELNQNALTNPESFITDISVVKTVSPGPYSSGNNVTFTIAVANLGSRSATNIIVSDLLSPGLQYVSSQTTTPTTSYNPVTGLWTIDELVNGDADTLVIVATITTTGFITNTAAITFFGDNNINNNISQITPFCASPAKPGAINGPISVCVGSTGHVYTIGPITGANYYTWIVPTGWTIVSGQGTTTLTVNAGTDTLNANIFVTTKSNTCNDESLPSTLEVFASNIPPAAPTGIIGPTDICRNQTDLIYSTPPIRGASSYTWSVPSGWTITAGQGTTSITVNAGTNSGPITVTASNGCGTSTATIMGLTPAPSAPPVPGAITGNSVPCAGNNNTTYSISSVAGATSYNWIVPAGWTIISGQGTTSITVSPGSAAGSVIVSAVNSCGKSANSSMPVNPTTTIPNSPGTISGTSTICASQTGLTYSIPAVFGASSYTWTVPSGWTIVSGQGSTSILVNAGTSAGNITVTASNGCGGSMASTLPITINTIPAVPAAINGTTVPCTGSNPTSYTIAAVPGATSYTWFIPPGWTLVSGQGTTSITVLPGSGTGMISVTASNSCGSSGLRNLNVIAASTPPPTPGAITGNTIPCASGTGFVYSILPVANAASYTWSVPTGYTITSGQGTTSITVTAGTTGGTISVSAVNGCGTGTSSTLILTPATIRPNAPGPISGINNVCVGLTTLTYSISSVTNASSYTWTVPTGWMITSGQGTTSITVTTNGSGGNVTVTASNGCGISAATVMAITPITTVPATPGAITGNTIPCAGTNLVTYSITAASGASSYTWTVPTGWTITSGQGTTTITVTPGSTSGNIRVNAVNSCGNSAFSTLPVTPATTPPAAPLTINGNTQACANSIGNVYSVNSVTNASSYNWTVPAGWSITAGQGTSTITVNVGTTGGTMSVTAQNDCGVSSSTSLSVTPVVSIPAAPGPITGNTQACAGSTGNSYSIASVATASSYLWTVPTGWTITAGQGTTTITVTSGTGSGSVTVAAINSCGTGPATTLTLTPITIVPTTPSAIAGSNVPCVGTTSVTYTIPATSGANSYTWTVPTGWTITAGQGTTSITVTPASTGGSVSVVAVNSCGNSLASTLPVTPASTPPAAPLAINGNTQACANSIGNVYSVNTTANASSYNWTVPAGWTITSGQGTTSITVNVGTTGGTMSVTAQNDCGGSSSTTLAVTPVVSIPAAPGPITGNTLACAGSTGNTYSISAVATASSYLWTVPTGWIITAGQGTTNITVTSGTGSGSISVAAINSCGSGPATTLSLTPITAAPVAPAAITGSTVPCIGAATINYSTAGSTGATSYNWTVPTGWTIVSGQGTTTITVQPGTAAGTVFVTAVNSCGNSPAQTTPVTPASTPPTAPIAINGNTQACAGSIGNIYSVTSAINASSYTWTVPAGWTITAGQGTATITVNVGTTGGTMSVTAQNDCGSSAATTLAVTPVISAPVTPGPISGNTSACAGSTGNTYSISTVATATSYVWTVPVGWAITAGQGTTSITVSAGTASGSITVEAVNSCGNGPASVVTVIAPTAAPVAPGPITGTTLVCGNQTSLTYSINSVANASAYNWTVPTGWTITSGQGSTSIIVTSGTTSGTISVTASNGCGSGTATTKTVTINPIPTTPIAITGDSIPCSGSALNTYSITAVSGATNYTWTVPTGWSILSGQGTTSIDVSVGSTSGQITVTAGNACGISTAASLPVNPATTVPASAGPIVGTGALCSGSVGLTYSIQPVANASSYTWTVPTGWVIISGQGTTIITVAAGTGAGTISVTAANGCGSSTASTQAVTLTTSAPGIPGLISGPTNPCAGQTQVTYSISAVSLATSYIWTVPSDWTIVSGQGTTTIVVNIGSVSGTVGVKASNDCGESAASTINMVTSGSLPGTPGAIAGTVQPCVGSTTTVFSVLPVSTATSYNWTVPSGWTIVSGQGTTSITVSVTNTGGTVSVAAENGCGSSPVVTKNTIPVTLAPVQTGPISGNGSVCAGQQANVYSVTAVANADNYIWTVPTGWTIISGQGTTSITVDAGQAGGTISVTAANDCGSSSATTQAVTISSPLQTPGPIADISSPCEGLSYSVPSMAGATTYTWTVPTGWTIISGQGTTTIHVKADDNGAGQVTVQASNGPCTSTIATIDADPNKGNSDVVIPTAFSPNGDNINDTWEITNILNYPDNELTVINRWGNEVFKANSYQNNWDGGSLSAGTYFYVMKVKMCGGEEKAFKGFVMIVK